MTDAEKIAKLVKALSDILDCLDLAADHDDLPLPFAGYGAAFITNARDAIFEVTGRPHDLPANPLRRIGARRGE